MISADGGPLPSPTAAVRGTDGHGEVVPSWSKEYYLSVSSKFVCYIYQNDMVEKGKLRKLA